MRKVFLTISLLVIFTAIGCSPAVTPVLVTPGRTASPASTGGTLITPQVLPTATPLPSPVKTPVMGTSGLHVTATVGPTCPGPQRPGQVCTRPYEGALVVTDSHGKDIATVTTDQNGQAIIDLPPGAYTIAPKIEGRYPAGMPTAATVSAGEYAEVYLELDTGIR